MSHHRAPHVNWRTVTWMRERPWHAVLEKFLWTLPAEDSRAYVSSHYDLTPAERARKQVVAELVKDLRKEYDHACHV